MLPLQKDLMVLNELHAVMATDALASSHPLSFREEEINTPAQISEVFDSIATLPSSAGRKQIPDSDRLLMKTSLLGVAESLGQACPLASQKNRVKSLN